MTINFNQPAEQFMTSIWMRIPQQYRHAAPWVILIGLLGYGFEMANLSLHHDDIVQFFHTDRIGHKLGRFGYSWIHYYIQRDYYAPFIQVFLGIVSLTVSGLSVAASWKINRTLDVVLVASLLMVFPYMAQHYSYNTSLLPFSIAHALSALAILLCVNFTLRRFLLAAILLGFAFSIYQSVIGNALALACFATVASLLTVSDQNTSAARDIVRTFAIPLFAIAGGGVLYLGLVAMIGIPSDPYQHADKAFTLSDGINIGTVIQLVIEGTRAFLFWPENYFPADLKAIQLGLIAAAGLAWFFVPAPAAKKAAAAAFLAGSIFAPRALQVLHPEGSFHNLTLTAYGVVVAGAVMLALRIRPDLLRNVVCLATAVLIFRFVMLSNWISTVNYLNFAAHQSVMTQILTRINDFPPSSISRPEVAVIGRLKMPDTYPFLPQTGIATDYIDLEHLGKLSSIMEQPVKFVGAEQLPKEVQDVAASAPVWPAPGSVFSANGMAVVVLSHSR